VNIVKYDSTFEGLLTLIYECYRLKIIPDSIIGSDERQSIIFDESLMVSTDLQKAEKVWNRIVEKTSKESANRLHIVFLSELPEAPGLVFDFVRLMLEKKYNIETDFTLAPVLKISKLFHKVAHETARVRQFTRFQQMSDGCFYASYSPKYNVLPLIIHHFTDRFADQRWIIYDLKRNFGFYFDLTETVRITFERLPANPVNGQLPLSLLGEDEQLFRQLWKKYCNVISIGERKNYRLHRQMLPKRFWRFLPEKN
jgi:probable DNA metabolism protein